MGKFLDALKNIGLKVNGTKPTSTTTVAVLNEIAEDYVAPQAALTFDTTPTTNSTNPVTSGGIKTYVDTLMSGALKRAIVEELPTTDIDTNTIYMVLDDTATQGNVYNEYLYINNAWELIGTTATSGGSALYQHNINFYVKDGYDYKYCQLVILNSTNTALTYNDVYNFLNTNGFIITAYATESESPDPAVGKVYSLGVLGDNFGVACNCAFIYDSKICFSISGFCGPSSGLAVDDTTVTDTVVQLS